MRPETTEPRDDATGWVARVDELDAQVLPEQLDGQLAAWRARADELLEQARADDAIDERPVEDHHEHVLEAIEAAQRTLQRDPAEGWSRDFEDLVATLMRHAEKKVDAMESAVPETAAAPEG